MKFFLSLISSCTILTSSFAAVDFSNLNQCVEEVKQNSALPNDLAPLFTNNYQSLLMKLQAQTVRGSFPVIYQQTMLDPFIAYLQDLGAAEFTTIFIAMQPSPLNGFLKSIIPDVTEALLQNGEQSIEKATNAFQEVVSDLYDGFLSDENRVSRESGLPIKLPDLGVLPPLVKWGNPQAGPYTWSIDATNGLQLGAAVVSLPPNNLRGGLLAWSALPHETAGHDILHADTGLLTELSNIVYNAIVTQLSNHVFLANYWRQCIDEIASDVVGLLNNGPTAGIGLVGYFRGLMGGNLRNIGYLPPADTHPVDILRGYVAARVVSQMPFADAPAWAAAIRQEVDKDLKTIGLLDGQTGQLYNLVQQTAIQSAEIVADTIVNSKLNALEGHSLKEIQNWNDNDQKLSETIGALLQSGASLPQDYRNTGYMAAHVVAGATLEALKANANIAMLFSRMLDFLAIMHQYNNTWKGNVAPPLPQDECTCICQCYQMCKQKMASHTPRRGSQQPVTEMALMDVESMAPQ